MGLKDQSYLTKNPLDNCNFVYLDMGTNLGVQIRLAQAANYIPVLQLWLLLRKLYEPHLYPGAPVVKIFDQYFGDFQARDNNQVRITFFKIYI